MAYVSNDFMKYVLEDVKKYEGLRHPLKASLIERALIRKIVPKRLHPNPDDEFTWPSVGPSYAIISKYMEEYQRQGAAMKPLYVEKMAPEDYMLINGHHRWAAAMRTNVKQVPIHIVNPTKEEDLISMVQKSNRTMRISLDLDEVLLVPADSPDAEKQPGFPANLLFKERIRKDFPAILQQLQYLGFDIWVYTASYLSDEYIRGLFHAYRVELDGVVNGVRRKKKLDQERINAIFSEKYTTCVHMDTQGVIITNSKEKSFDSFDIDTSKSNWASEAVMKIREFV